MTDQRLAVLLGVALVSGVLVMLSLVPEAVALVLNLGLVAIAYFTMEERRRQGGGWWGLLALGAVLSLLGELVSHVSNIVGGVIATIGAVAVVAGATIGFPVVE